MPQNVRTGARQIKSLVIDLYKITVARTKPTVAELMKELTGGLVLPAPKADEERWGWIDYSVLPLSDFLQLVGIPKGRFESYTRRKTLDLESFGTGRGVHLKYTPRDAMKIMAIDGLSRAGAWDWCLYQAFRKNGTFDLDVNSYQFGQYTKQGRPEPIVMNTEQDRLLMETGKPDPFANALELNLARMKGQWPPKDWCWLTFDVDGFLKMAIPRIVKFFRQHGVEIRDL